MNAYAYNGQKVTPVVEIYHDVIPYLGNITEKEFYTDTEKCIAAWQQAAFFMEVLHLNVQHLLFVFEKAGEILQSDCICPFRVL